VLFLSAPLLLSPLRGFSVFRFQGMNPSVIIGGFFSPLVRDGLFLMTALVTSPVSLIFPLPVFPSRNYLEAHLFSSSRRRDVSLKEAGLDYQPPPLIPSPFPPGVNDEGGFFSFPHLDDCRPQS